MGRGSKKPRQKLDPKKVFLPGQTKKKDKDVDGDDIFEEMRRSKPYRR